MFDNPVYLAKVISQLPQNLSPNAVYFVRNGYGVDLYVTDATGQIAHSLNPPFINTIYSGFPQEVIANLKQQNKLLEENIKLLQEQVKLLKGQVEIVKVAYEEERKKANWSLVEKGKLFGIGVMAGALLMFIFGM